MTKTNLDRIEKAVVLRAPIARVWHAVSDAREFGSWFGVDFDGEFMPGRRVSGRVTNPPGYEHLPFEIWIERVEPETLLSFRWHPYAIEPDVDYASEPTTLVVFELEEMAEGTRLTIVESGFDAIPASRRAKAFLMNDQGWSEQAKAIERYLADGL